MYPRNSLPRRLRHAGAIYSGHALKSNGAVSMSQRANLTSHGAVASSSFTLRSRHKLSVRLAQRRQARQLRLQHQQIVHEKLHDKQLRTNLITALHLMQGGRQYTIDHKMVDWQGLRCHAQAIKGQTLQQLPQMLEEFERNATANGIKVHYAQDSNDVCTILLELMQANHVRHVIKGKSMVAEEIGLNEFLRAHGVDLEASDLGDLIVHLMDEPPVHILGPSLHLNRHQIGQVFAAKLHVPVACEIEKLNAIARDHLRQGFAHLKMGLSGVNFAAVKEGAIWLVENEGNGRMCTTSPDIYVALCGIEKLVPDLDSAAALSHILTPSANGQFIPAYSNIITGPRKEGELDGPKEVHVILIDNGRTNVYAHQTMQAALRCIRCSACMNFCPVFDKLGGHAYLTTYPGPIGEVISPLMRGMESTGHILSFCTLCGRCEQVCPERIPLMHLIRQLRAQQHAASASSTDTAAKSSAGATGTADKHAPQVQHAHAKAAFFKLFTQAATNGTLWSLMVNKAHTLDFLLQRLGPVMPVTKAWAQYKDLPSISHNLLHEVSKLKDVEVQ